MALRNPDRPVLACPACAAKYGGAARIGNRKGSCTLCNRFAQKVRRQVATDLIRAYPGRARTFRSKAERAAYESVVSAYAPAAPGEPPADDPPQSR